MSNLTAERNLLIEAQPGSGTLNIEATNGTTFYRGGLLAINTGTGYAVKHADTSGLEWLGVCSRTVTGDTSATPPKKVEVITGPVILRNVAVSGTSAVTHQGDYVYATDDQTLTVSATSNTKPIGIVLKWHVSTTCDVLLFSPQESRAS